MAKFAVQGIAAEKIYDSLGKTPKEMSSSENISVSLASGVVAGVAAAIISHPADTLLSKINKAGAGGSGGMFSRLANIAAETGTVEALHAGARRALRSSITLVPIRPRSRGERRSSRTFAVVSLRPGSLAFNPDTPRRLSTPLLTPFNRCVMIGTLTAGQFGIFDIVMNAVGASKFHFHDPSKGDH